MIFSTATRFLFGCLFIAAATTTTEGATLRGSARKLSGTITGDWDAACPSQAYALGQCVATNGGYLEICKACVKTAAHMDSTEFALEGCANDRYMCNGCGKTMMAYYSCGTGEPLTVTAHGNSGLLHTHDYDSGSHHPPNDERHPHPHPPPPQQQRQRDSGFWVEYDPSQGNDWVEYDTRQGQNPSDTREDVIVHSSTVPDSVQLHDLINEGEIPPTHVTVPAPQAGSVHVYHLHDQINDEETPPAHPGPGLLPTEPAAVLEEATAVPVPHDFDDWDLACPAHAYDLENCVSDTGGGHLELCKDCIKMASTFSSGGDPDASTALLDACGAEPAMCNGCRDSLQSYYDCGLRHDDETAATAGSGLEIQVANAVPEDRTDETDPVLIAHVEHLHEADSLYENREITYDWDARCPTHVYDLSNCVANQGGVLELCKACAKMASTLDSSGFALDGCAEDATMCNGCRNSLQGYFDCGVAVHPAP